MEPVYKLAPTASIGIRAASSELAAAQGRRHRARLAAALAIALGVPTGAAMASEGNATAPCVDGRSPLAGAAPCAGAGAIALQTSAQRSAPLAVTATDLVVYDPGTQTVQVGAGVEGNSVDFRDMNSSTRTLQGVRAGTVNTGSTEAVNGSQLFATNTRVGTAESNIAAQTIRITNVGSGMAAALGGGATVGPDGRVTAPNYAVGGITANDVGTALGNLDGRVVVNEGDIVDLKTRIDSGNVGLVLQAAPGTELTVGAGTDGAAVNFANNAGVARTLTNVADGDLSAASREAVNGAQLFATNERVGRNETSLTAIDGRVTVNEGDIVDLRSQIGSGNVGLVLQAAPGTELTVGAGTDGAAVNFANNAGVARTLTNVADGDLSAASREAVNGAQLFATNERVGRNETSLTAIDGRVTINEGDIVDLRSQIGSGNIGLVRQAAAGDELTVGSATDGTAVNFANNAGVVRTLRNVADGDLSATSHDAVNGSQLHATNERVSTNETDIRNLDGRVTVNEGDITTLNRQIIELGSGAIGMVTYDAAAGSVNIGSAHAGAYVNVGGTTGARRVGGVANGVNDDEAATIAQLKASGLVDPNDGRALSALVYDDVSLARATLGGSNGTVIGNLGNGLVAAGSREAINGGQLFQINADWEARFNGLDGRVTQLEANPESGFVGGPDGHAGTGAGSVALGDDAAASGAGAVAIGSGSVASADNAVAIGSGSVADRANELSVGSAGNERIVSNVAAGVRPNDAVNVQQMDDRFKAERDFTEGRFQVLDKRLDRMAATSAAYAGMAMNTAGLSGDNRVGAGVGAQNGRTALAVGYQRILGEKKNISVSLGGAFSGSEKSVSGGAGFSW